MVLLRLDGDRRKIRRPKIGETGFVFMRSVRGREIREEILRESFYFKRFV